MKTLFRRALAPALALVVVAAGPALADIAGTDVASYQHPNGTPISWSAVKSSGQSFTFIKATESVNYTNPHFASDYAAAAGAGLYRGAYHFARPSLGAGSAVEQARFFASVIGPQTRAGMLPPVLDLEQSGGLNRDQLIGWTSTFLTTLQSLTGRTPILYSFPSFLQNSLGSTTALRGYPLWIAHYTGAPAPSTPGFTTYAFWQYSSSGTVPGISGRVDMNRFNGTSAQLAQLARASAPAAPTAPTAPTEDPTGVTPPALVAISPPSRYTAVTPSRFVDTRTGLGARRGQVSGPLTVAVPASVPTDASGVVLNVSAVNPARAGYLRAAPAGSTPLATALNFVARQSYTGLVVARTDAARQATLTVAGGPTDLVVDVVGYYDTAAGSGGHWVASPPTRFVDSRIGQGTAGGTKNGDVTVTLPAGVPQNARGAVLNVSVVDAVHDTYVRIAPTGTAPTTTALNVHGGQSQTGLVMTAAAGRQVTFSVLGGPAHLVIDLIGYYDGASSAGSSYVGTTPQRFLDTRSRLGSGQARVLTITLPAVVPAAATGVVLNVSTVDPTGTGYLRVAAAGREATTTAINFTRGQSQTGLVVTGIAGGRQVTISMFGGMSHVVADLVGYQAPNA
ncbi:MAG: glycoside hydrolase family 25 [Frankiales bacterium]|nr:glycoside hydrolase family 25 [Frankiales bacterium]